MNLILFNIITGMIINLFSNNSSTDKKGNGTPYDKGTYTNITAEQARQTLISGEDVLFLDVREVYEYNAGHIRNAVNMPWNSGDVAARHTELPAKKIIVYCASGNRSAKASQFLADNGHNDIFNMLGGYSAWVALPPLPQSATGWVLH